VKKLTNNPQCNKAEEKSWNKFSHLSTSYLTSNCSDSNTASNGIM